MNILIFILLALCPWDRLTVPSSTVLGSISGHPQSRSCEPRSKAMPTATATLQSRQACLVTDLPRIISQELCTVIFPGGLDSGVPRSPGFLATSVAMPFQCPWGLLYIILPSTGANSLVLLFSQPTLSLAQGLSDFLTCQCTFEALLYSGICRNYSVLLM